MKIQEIKLYSHYSWLLLVLLFFTSGCTAQKIDKKHLRTLKRYEYMKGYVHGQSTNNGKEGRTEYERFKEQIEDIR